MKTIGIDIRVLAKGTKTGIEEYTSNLLSFLLSLDKNIKYKLFYNAFSKTNLDYPWLNLENVELKEFNIPNRALNFYMRVFNRPKIDKILNGVDLFFSPHFLPAALSKSCKRVVTFHDLSFIYYPQFFSRARKLWHFLTFPKQQAQKADKIIAVSQSTKEDLIKIYKIKPDKIKVIYSGISNKFKPIKNKNKLDKIRKKYSLPKNFILYFGTIEPRKNLVNLIKAFDNLKHKNLKLVIAGTRGWLYKDVFQAVKNSKNKQNIIFTGFIESQDKPYLYNLADIFVYPSFFEGFGFPPLEAMSCGIPTITSNTSSLPEIVGQGAIMINPYKIDEITSAIYEVLNDQSLRKYLAQKGIEQAKKFNWDKSAKQVLDIFSQIK